MMRSRSSFVNTVTGGEVREQNVDVLFMVWLASRSTEALVDAALAPAGLTGDEMAIYSMLAASPSTTPTELARWMAAPATTVSSYVKRFEARGHVVRDPNPDDRRSYVLRLTPDGQRVHRDARTRLAPVSAAVEEALENPGAAHDALLKLRGAADAVRSATQPTA